MYGDGSLKLEKNGRYKYWTIQYYDVAGKKCKKRFPYTDEGKRDAKKFQKETVRRKEKGILTTCEYTVSSWIQYYIETCRKPNLRNSSYERLVQTYNKIKVSPIGSIPLDKLDGMKAQDFYNMLADSWIDENENEQKKLSSSSISKIHKLLLSAYKKAVQQRIIEYNPIETVASVKVRTKEMTVFTWKEIGKIFRAIDRIKNNKHNSKQRYDYKLLFMMLLETGCRVGELLALRWEDINFSKREIHICRTKCKNGQEFNDTKTTAGNRYVPIIFDKMLARLKENRTEDSIIKLSGYVFANRNGGAISYYRVLECWKHICKLTGIEKNIHTFRHTNATLLLEKGVPVAEVSRMLGHADATITYKLYVHAIPNYNQKVIEMFGQNKQKKEVHTQKCTQII